MSSSNPVIRGKSLYAVVDGPTWEEAETNSVALGGHLVTINDAEENEWISSNFTYNHSDIPPLWIGYTDKLQEGTWSWSSGESTSYTNWERLIGKEPNGGSNQNHGVIYLDRRTSYPYLLGSWNDAPNENYGQLGIAEIPFIRRGDSAYVIVEGPTWDEAEANALALGGHLVTINDAEEDEWIKNNIEWKVPKDPNYGAYKYDQAIAYWIGLNDHEKEGVTVWSSGELSTYRRNLSSDSFGTEDWFTIVNLSGGWNDLTQTPGDWSMGNWQMEYGIAEIPLAPNKTPTGTLTLTGDYKVGNTISIDTSTIEDADNFEGWTPTYEYSWEVSNDNGTSWAALIGTDANDGDNKYTLTTAEAGKQLRGVVSYFDGYGTNEQVISAQAPIAPEPEPEQVPGVFFDFEYHALFNDLNIEIEAHMSTGSTVSTYIYGEQTARIRTDNYEGFAYEENFYVFSSKSKRILEDGEMVLVKNQSGDVYLVDWIDSYRIEEDGVDGVRLRYRNVFTPEPEPTPETESTPNPEATPEPEPTPGLQPEPTPEPDPAPEPEPEPEPTPETENPVFRLYNSAQGRHLFSSNEAEIDILTGNGWQNEGVSYFTPEEATAEVFRFYISDENRHFYTALEIERDMIIANQDVFSDWQYEGGAFSAYSKNDFPENAVAVVRYLNEVNGKHVYSTSTFEQSLLDQNSNWVNEGIAWYGAPINLELL